MRKICLVFTALSAVGFADTIHLNSGKAVQGVVVQETASQLQVETSAGIVKFAASEIVRIDRDNAQVVASLGKLVEAGKGAEVIDRIGRLDRSRFSASELAAIDQLAAQVNQQSAAATAQSVNQQDQQVTGEARAIFDKLGWRESAKYLEQACAASQHPLPNAQFALIELYAAHATYPEAVDFTPKADQIVAGTNPQYKATLLASRQKLDQRMTHLRVEKEKRDNAFASAGEARARLDQATQQRTQAAAVQGAMVVAANPQKFAPKPVDKSKIEAANKTRASMLQRESMEKVGAKFNCQGGVCPTR